MFFYKAYLKLSCKKADRLCFRPVTHLAMRLATFRKVYSATISVKH